MKNLTLLALLSSLIFACQSDSKETPKKSTQTESKELNADSRETIYTSNELSPIEYMKRVIDDNDERHWTYWTEIKKDPVELGVKEVDGLEAVYFKSSPGKLYEIVPSSGGFSLFLGDKRLQWYEQTEPGYLIKSDKKVHTVEATSAGYFEDVIIATDDPQYAKEPLPKFDILHVVPSYVEGDGLQRYMNTVALDEFQLNGGISNWSGLVEVFYDKEKRHKVVSFQAQKGQPNGNVKVYSPKGRVIIERDYDQGQWLNSKKEPACVDWTYNMSTSSLMINDVQFGKSTKEGVTSIELVPSVHDNANFYEILNKSSYERPFLVNNQPFTGQLLAFDWPTHREEYPTFELNFENGKLHGDVKVYEAIFGLTLHEVFDSGELAETVYVMDPNEMDGVAKPILYFYPETTTDLTINLNFEGKLTHTYPKYKNAWKVTAHPDGTLFDEDDQEYYALYWEGENDRPFTLNEGAVIKGENTIAFLEASLETLGLNRREANEFIMYWLPRMENNAYNLIHFSTEEYEAMAELNIDPAPETIIRVMMVFQSLEEEITMKAQNLQDLSKTRKGFTVVEWGGKEVKRTTIF